MTQHDETQNMTHQNYTKAVFEAAMRRLLDAVKENDSYEEEVAICEAALEQWANVDPKDRLIEVLKDAKDEAENLWDGCNYDLEDANAKYETAANGSGAKYEMDEDAIESEISEALKEVEDRKAESESAYKVYAIARNAYDEAVELFREEAK